MRSAPFGADVHVVPVDETIGATRRRDLVATAVARASRLVGNAEFTEIVERKFFLHDSGILCAQ